MREKAALPPPGSVIGSVTCDTRVLHLGQPLPRSKGVTGRACRVEYSTKQTPIPSQINGGERVGSDRVLFRAGLGSVWYSGSK